MSESIKILLIEDNEDALEIMAMILESEFNCQVIKTISCHGAYNSLKKHNDIKMIISDYNLPDGLGSDIYQFSRTNYRVTPFLLMTSSSIDGDSKLENFTESKFNFFLKKPFNSHTFNETVSNLLKELKATQELDYKKLDNIHFEKYVTKPMDVFIKIPTDKFVQIANENGPKLVKEDLAHYDEKGIKFFYIRTADFESNITTKIDNLFIKLQQNLKNENIDHAEKVQAEVDAVELIHESLKQFGVNESTIKLAKLSVQSAISTVNKNHKVKNLLNALQLKNSYLYKHSVATTAVAIAILENLPWNSDQLRTKFAFASLLMDISISDDEMGKILVIDEAVHKKYTQKEISSYKDHPIKSIALCAELDDVDADVKNFIMYHHERPGSSGFPKGAGDLSIPTLCCLFIIAHEFSARILIDGLSMDIARKTVKSINDNFKNGNFKVPLDAFNKTFKCQ